MMKNIRIKIVGWIGLILWIMALAQIVVMKGFEKNVTIMEAFSKEEQVTVEKCGSEIIGRTENENESDKVSNIIEDLVKLNENAKCEITDISDSLGIEGISERAVLYDNDILMTVTTTCYNKSPYTYIHVETEGKEDNTETINELKEYCDGHDIEYALYSKICGVSGKTMTEEECREYARDIFGRMGADMIEEHYDRDYIAYGYSESLQETIKYGDRKVNIQVMISTNELEKKSEIIIGTPILLE